MSVRAQAGGACVFVISGLIFAAMAATAVTYTEATVMLPEAGGSSSFARHGL